MAEQPPFFPSRDGPGFEQISVESDTPRAVMQPHYVLEDGQIVLVVPASGMTLGAIQDARTGEQMPAIRMRSAMAAGSLVYIMMAEELRSLGTAMIAQADEMDARARAAFDDVIQRAKNGGAG